MITSPLLSNVRHRSMKTPVSLLLARLVHISPSCWAIYRLFEIITVRWIGLQIQCSIQIHCFKIHLVRYELYFKNDLLQRGARAFLKRISLSKALANEVERTPTTIYIVLFRSPAIWTRKARHGMKIYVQWQGPKKRARGTTSSLPPLSYSNAFWHAQRT